MKLDGSQILNNDTLLSIITAHQNVSGKDPKVIEIPLKLIQGMTFYGVRLNFNSGESSLVYTADDKDILHHHVVR